MFRFWRGSTPIAISPPLPLGLGMVCASATHVPILKSSFGPILHFRNHTLSPCKLHANPKIKIFIRLAFFCWQGEPVWYNGSGCQLIPYMVHTYHSWCDSPPYHTWYSPTELSTHMKWAMSTFPITSGKSMISIAYMLKLKFISLHNIRYATFICRAVDNFWHVSCINTPDTHYMVRAIW